MNEYLSQSDEELVVESLKNQQAFAVLVERYQAPLTRYIQRLTNVNTQDAEDLLQEVFIKIYYNLNGFDTTLQFSSWAYRITHNVVISEHRKKSVRPHGNQIDIEQSVLEQFASELDAGKLTDAHLLKENLHKILDRLPPKYKEVLVLKFLEEKEYKEISDILQKPMGTVATLISRAKKAFIKEVGTLEKDLFY